MPDTLHHEMASDIDAHSIHALGALAEVAALSKATREAALSQYEAALAAALPRSAAKPAPRATAVPCPGFAAVCRRRGRPAGGGQEHADPLAGQALDEAEARRSESHMGAAE